jgi:hypothetical protein
MMNVMQSVPSLGAMPAPMGRCQEELGCCDHGLTTRLEEMMDLTWMMFSDSLGLKADTWYRLLKLYQLGVLLIDF